MLECGWTTRGSSFAAIVHETRKGVAKRVNLGSRPVLALTDISELLWV